MVTPASGLATAKGQRQPAANKLADQIQIRLLRKKEEDPFPATNNSFILIVLRQQLWNTVSPVAGSYYREISAATLRTGFDFVKAKLLRRKMKQFSESSSENIPLLINKQRKATREGKHHAFEEWVFKWLIVAGN